MNIDDGSIFQYSIQRCIVGNGIYSLTVFILRVVPLHKTNTATELVYYPWNCIYITARAIIYHIICMDGGSIFQYSIQRCIEKAINN